MAGLSNIMFFHGMFIICLLSSWGRSRWNQGGGGWNRNPGWNQGGGGWNRNPGWNQGGGGWNKKPGSNQGGGGWNKKPGSNQGGGWNKPGGNNNGGGGQPQQQAKPAPTGNCACGCAKIAPTGAIARIVGGSQAKANSWPWQIRLVRQNGQGVCGGSLIADRWVLTAAHCVAKSSNGRDYTVYAGMHKTSEQRSGAQRLGVTQIVTNPNYGRTIVGGEDIALVKLSSTPSFNDKVQKVCLASDDSSEARKGTQMTVTGWGKTSDSSGQSSVLKQVTITVLGSANGQCKTQKEICAPHKSSGASFYKGDSGGPLVRKRGNNWYQFGIVSGNRRQNVKSSPTIYARVSAHCNWIQKVTGQRICK